ncbi:hypothetical protein [Dinghuibacter silviterrae]|uniref:DUF4397 domain-containing protein n=1 Tax=Dinghuibacter silviterrae TaxID=1539049 RepID=A0A4R8DHM5_9BACT|nr:hypothetical protein [Dinghuibacter silviterrae]TDW97035.1 hypothetical protein EDB95_4872 [Dinghuibacter silviterrae]
MKKRVSAILMMVLGSMLLFMGCSKTAYFEPHSPTSFYTTDASVAPFYGDTVLRVTGSTLQDYLFRPAAIKSQGHFVTWPAGLVVDPQTGVINAALSEPGARYNVGFVSAKTGDTAYSQVVLAGISFSNTVYIKNDGDSVLAPYAMGGTITGIGNHAINLNALQPGTHEIKVSFRMDGGAVQTTTVLVSFSDVPPPPLVETMSITASPASKVTVTNVKPTAPAPCTPRPPQIVIINKGH